MTTVGGKSKEIESALWSDDSRSFLTRLSQIFRPSDYTTFFVFTIAHHIHVVEFTHTESSIALDGCKSSLLEVYLVPQLFFYSNLFVK